MATALGVSPSYLSKIETGAQDPTEKFKINCAKFLKVTVESLFSDKDIEEVFPDFTENLGNRLWALRRIKGIRQYDMAKKLEVSTPFLSKVELGLIDPPESFKKNCSRIFKLPVNELFLTDQKKNKKSK
jgi:transcriptional regulator with XRE-family HTH domain